MYEKDTISGKNLQKYVLDNLKDIDVDVVTKKVTGQYQEKEDTKEDINYTLKGVLQREGITLYQTPTLTEKRQDKKAKKDKKKNKKLNKVKDDFMSTLIFDNSYDSYGEFEEDMLNFTASNIFK